MYVTDTRYPKKTSFYRSDRSCRGCRCGTRFGGLWTPSVSGTVRGTSEDLSLFYLRTLNLDQVQKDFLYLETRDFSTSYQWFSLLQQL